MATVALVRHGETTWNRDGRIQGWADSRLTDRGREQARAAGAHLAATYDVDRLVASDLQRTRETASLVREAGVEADLTLSRAWRERDFGEYQGLTRTAVASRSRGYQTDGSLLTVSTVPGGESLPAAKKRVRGGWEELCGDLATDETAVVVTHGGTIRAVVAEVTGRDLSVLAEEFSPDNCGVTEVRLAADGSTAIECRDDVSYRES